MSSFFCSFFSRRLRRFVGPLSSANSTRSGLFGPAITGALLCLGLSVANGAAQAPSDKTKDGEARSGDAVSTYNPLAAGTYQMPPVAAPTLTPELPQQTERQNRMQEANIRNLIRSFGVGSRDLQDMVIAHIANETQAREPMRAASGRLLQAMRTPGMTDAQLSVLLNDCRVSFDIDKTRRAEGLDALKTKIGAQLTPRLESVILLLGLEGDVIITLPTPAMLSQMQRERQQLLKMVDGLKIEADSLRRERDDVKTERDAMQNLNVTVPNNLIRQTANAQIIANGIYSAPNAPTPSAPPVVAEEQKELTRLREENDKLKKENKRLQRENRSLQRPLKDDGKKENR